MFQRLKRRIGDMRVIRSLCLHAEAHARRDGLREPGAEHFLLASLDLPDGTARRAFERVGGTHDSLAAAIVAEHARALGEIGLDMQADLEPEALGPAHGLYRATPPGREVMRQLAATRRIGDPTPLVGAHVVAAVAALPRGVAARALRTMRIDHEALRRAAIYESGVAREPR